MKIRRWIDKNKNNKSIKVKMSKTNKNGGENMETLIYNNFKEALDKISSKLPLLEGKNGMIKLDKNNHFHQEWFEDDEE